MPKNYLSLTCDATESHIENNIKYVGDNEKYIVCILELCVFSTDNINDYYFFDYFIEKLRKWRPNTVLCKDIYHFGTTREFHSFGTNAALKSKKVLLVVNYVCHNEQSPILKYIWFIVNPI